MSRLTLDELIAATQGRCRTGAGGKGRHTAIRRVVIDSRDVRPGDVFWALPGMRVDGAEFIGDAYRQGAAGTVSSRAAEPPAGRWAIEVHDAAEALVAAARWQRNRFQGRVVAVTGSVGKTTTRQMIHAALGAGQSGSASPRNYNNHVGLPLSMLGWRHDHDYAVVELGASAAGEIAALADICRPQVGVITQLGEAHLGTFGSREALAGAKAELLDALPRDGLAILSADDARIRPLVGRCTARVVTVGRSAEADYAATGVRSSGGLLEFTANGHEMAVPVWGRHHLTSALMAIAVARHLGVTWPAITTGLADFRSPQMRCEVREWRGATIINDCYNASPTAMRAALELLRDFDAAGRRIALCGDMRELGPETPQLHRQVGDQVVTVCGADVLIACGEHAEHVIAGARAAGMAEQCVFTCRDACEAADVARQVVTSDDVLLVKGSRAVGLERCLALLNVA